MPASTLVVMWFRSANSHTGPQLYRCIRGRTDGSIRQHANPQNTACTFRGVHRWKGRDRYQAHITWMEGETRYGPENQPVIVIQSVHNLPINVTRIRLRNGFGWQTDGSPFAGDCPDDYPDLPRTIEPMAKTTFWLDSHAFDRALKQSKYLNWLWVPRVYVSVQTMGRGERRFSAEGGLKYGLRRRRYR